MCERLTFADLGEDVLNIIISMLHSEAPKYLRNVCSVSRAYKTPAEPFLYRTIVLSDVEEDVETTKHKVHRLLDQNDSISQYVRHLRIHGRQRGLGIQRLGVYKPDSEIINATDLEKIIGKVRNLQHFSWDVNKDIPGSVISLLEQQWPHVKLSVGNHDRAKIDKRLMSSPLLHSLSFGILNHTATVTATDQLAQYSLLPKLKEILLESPNLRKLDIKFEYNWISRRVKWTGNIANPHPLNLPLDPSDRLPPLQELTFSGPGETYEFDSRHCQVLRQCMDWTHLRRLDLGLSCPQHFFEEIGGSLHSLRSLTMGIRTGDRYYTHWPHGPLTCENLGTVTTFLESVPNLRELNITDLESAAEELAPTIIATHKSLRKLSYYNSINRKYRRRKPPSAWTITQLQDLREQCPNLSHLEIDVVLAEGRWPDTYAHSIFKFNTLSSLKVFVELSEDGSDFAAEYHQDVYGSKHMPPLNEDLAQEISRRLFKGFFENNAYARLRELEVCFKHQEVEDRCQRFDVEQSVKVRRLERDDAPSPLEGGFEVESDGKWISV